MKRLNNEIIGSTGTAAKWFGWKAIAHHEDLTSVKMDFDKLEPPAVQ